MKPFTIAGPALLCWLAGWSMVGGQENAEAALQASAGGHDRDWRKCEKCRPAVEKALTYLKENSRKQDQWYDGALGNFYAGFAFLIEGNSPKELDDCCKKARYFIEKPPGYNQWIVGMSTLFLCEVSLRNGLTPENREAITKAVQFFEKTQEATGGWHHGNNDYYTKDIAMVGTIVYAALVEAKALGIETGAFVDRARKYLDDICDESFGYSSGGKDGDVSSGRGSYTLFALLVTLQFEDPLVRKLSRAVERRYMNCANGHANGALHYFGVAVAAHRMGPEMYLKYAGEYIDKVLAVAQPDGSVGSFPHDCPKEKEAAAYAEMRTKDNPGYETRFCATAVLACMLMLQEEGCFTLPNLPGINARSLKGKMYIAYLALVKRDFAAASSALQNFAAEDSAAANAMLDILATQAQREIEDLEALEKVGGIAELQAQLKKAQSQFGLLKSFKEKAARFEEGLKQEPWKLEVKRATEYRKLVELLKRNKSAAYAGDLERFGGRHPDSLYGRWALEVAKEYLASGTIRNPTVSATTAPAGNSTTPLASLETPGGKLAGPTLAAPARRAVSPEALAQWQARFVKKLDALAKGGAKLKVDLGDKQEYVLRGANEALLLVGTQGSELPMPWRLLSPTYRAALARVAATDDDVEALLIAAVMHLACEQNEQAEDLFAKAALKDAGAVKTAKAALAGF